MAITNCKECKKEVSDSAKCCPHCGYTDIIKDRKKAEADAFAASPSGMITTLIILAVVVFFVYSCVSDGKRREDEYSSCQERGREFFKDRGLWPTLKNGSDAEKFISEQCSNSAANSIFLEPKTETVNSVVKEIDFNSCVKTAKATTDSIHVPHNVVVNTKIVYMVKIHAADGDILITCSKPDRKMTTTITKGK